MAAFTSPAKNWDVFISYAQVAEKDWVIAFHKELQRHLDRELHQTDAAAIFWDEKSIRGEAPLTAEIVQALDNSAVMVVVLSHAYADRPWCRKECSHFLDLCGKGSGRVFVAAIENVPLDARPPEIVQHELLGFEFWEQHPETHKAVTRPKPPDEDAFDAEIRTLADSIATRLRDLKTQFTTVAAPNAGELQGCTVFLADGETGHPLVKEIEAYRSQVRTWLIELGANVVPQAAGSLFDQFYNNRPICLTETERLIAEATVFVQLLGRKWDGDRYEQWLCDRAVAAGKSNGKDLLLWRPKSLDVAALADDTHQKLVGGDQVIACELVNEFLPLLKKKILAIETDRKIKDRAPPPADGAPANRKGLVLVDSADEDQPLSDQLLLALEQNGTGYDAALSGLEDFRKMMASEKIDAIALVYGKCQKTWAIERFRAIRPICLESKPRPRIAVFRESPNRPLPVSTDAIMVIHANRPDEIKAFTDRVREVVR